MTYSRNYYWPSRGSDNRQAKLSDDKVREIRVLLSEGGKTQRQIANLYKVDPAVISKIKSGERWGHVK